MADFTENNTNSEPYTNYRYKVEIDKKTVGGFSEVSAPRVEHSVVEYHEGGVNDTVHTFPDRLTYSNVTLHRGLTANEDFFNWMMESATVERETIQKDVHVTLVDRAGSEVWSWEFFNAYPVRWEGPRMNADPSDGISIELVEFAFESLSGGARG